MEEKRLEDGAGEEWEWREKEGGGEERTVEGEGGYAEGGISEEEYWSRRRTTPIVNAEFLKRNLKIQLHGVCRNIYANTSRYRYINIHYMGL